MQTSYMRNLKLNQQIDGFEVDKMYGECRDYIERQKEKRQHHSMRLYNFGQQFIQCSI